MATRGITYAATDLDDFAATLAALATAIERRDHAAAWSLAYEIALHDLDLSAALADFLTFAGLTAEEVNP